MIAYIKELSVKKNKWLNEEQFKDGVVLCQSIPGATAIQMAAYVGLRLKGIGGALASYVGFGLPAFALMLILSILYTRSQQLPFVQSLFAGLQVIVVAIIAQGHLFLRENHSQQLSKYYGGCFVGRIPRDRYQPFSGYPGGRFSQYHFI